MFYSFGCGWKWDHFLDFIFRHVVGVKGGTNSCIMLILYPATLLNLFVLTDGFCVHDLPYDTNCVTRRKVRETVDD